jgi:molybdate transport system ATP-binding protein
LVERTADEKIGTAMKLEIRQLSLRLERFTLEANVDLHNARTGIFGPSGSGKTSLLETIAGLRKPEMASIALDNQSFESTAQNYSLPIRLRRIGYVPQDDSLFPHLSVRHNLLYGSNGKSKDRTLSFEHVTSFLEITSLLDRHVQSLSRGENQRIVIARALLSAPRLLLLDEPLTALDAKLKDAILEQLGSLHREFGIPMLYVTHDPKEAIEICEEILMLESGKIIARGSPRELLA